MKGEQKRIVNTSLCRFHGAPMTINESLFINSFALLKWFFGRIYISIGKI